MTNFWHLTPIKNVPSQKSGGWAFYIQMCGVVFFLILRFYSK